MKRPSALSTLLALVLLLLPVFTGCKQEAAPPAETRRPAAAPAPSAEPTSFKEVTSQLDPGGSLYLYLGTEQWLASVSRKAAAWRGLLGAVPDLKAEDRQNLDKALDIVTNFIQQSGVEDVSGLGLSSIARETNFYHSKLVMHHYPGKNSGLLWNTFGQRSHPLDDLNLLPASTALAAFTDLNPSRLWSVIQKQIAQSGLPKAEETLSSLTDSFQNATGLKWDRVLASLNDEFGIAVTLDDTKVIPIPTSGEGDPLQIPEPALLLFARVKDDTLFNRIDQALTRNAGKQIIRSDKPGLRMRTWPLPLPLPILLRPTVATTDGYLVIASTDAIIQEVLAVKANQRPGLKSSQEFQRLAKDVPAQGNGFIFVSQRFGQTLAKVQDAALRMTGTAPGSQTAILQSLLGSGKPTFLFAVAANTDEGWRVVANGNQHPAQLLAASAAIPVGVLAAVAVPNFAKARHASEQNACLNNLRIIEGAKQQWALENKKIDSDEPTSDDLKPYLPKGQFPACPAGGTYSINRLADSPQCSHEGHTLPK